VPLIYFSREDDPEPWRALMLDCMPNLDFRVYPEEEGNLDEVRFALVNAPPSGFFARYRNLEGVLCLFAGVDRLILNGELSPPNVPVIRLVSSDLTRGMTEYIVMHVLRYYRQLDAYLAQSKERRWQVHSLNELYRQVGILGLGTLGADVAGKLAGMGFDVSGWSRTAKEIPKVRCFHGPAQLDRLLEKAGILVSLLPLTRETENLIDRQLLYRLPRGAFLINAARGAQVVDNDMLEALDSGQLRGATLDVFRDEPLPASSPLWLHPGITITPHVASVTRPCRESARWFTRNIEALLAGQPPLGGVVDRERGY